MLTTNLSTRPFYNERLVHVVLGLLGAVVVTALAAGTTRLVELSQANSELTAVAVEAEREAARITTEMVILERVIDDAEIEMLRDAAEEANRLIGQRVFSWTEFFNIIEQTLPANVMLTAVRPNMTEEGMYLELAVIGRRIVDIDEFILRLEATGMFTGVLARQEDLTEGGMYRAELYGELLSIDMNDELLDGPTAQS